MRRKSRSIFEHTDRFRGAYQERDWEPHAPADRPTDSRPGSAERMREYRRRLELGREMWHEDDQAMDDGV